MDAMAPLSRPDVHVGSELLAKATVGRRGNLNYDGRKWPQRADELRRLGKWIVAEGVRSYLEIGLHCGFTLRYLGGLLPRGSRIVGVDLIDKDHVVQRTDALRVAAAALQIHGHEVHLIIGDSTAPETVEKVRKLGPYDFVLIDGDHTMPGARGDWDAYGPMGRIVAFHDIDADRHQTRDPELRSKFAVQELWRELKPHYRHAELIGRIKGAGFGVLWRA